MSLTGVPAASLSFVRATMSAGAVSSTNCTRGSMDCGYATGRTIGVILLRSRVPACPVSSRGCPVSAGMILLFWGDPVDTGDLVGEVDLAVIGWLVAYGLAGVGDAPEAVGVAADAVDDEEGDVVGVFDALGLDHLDGLLDLVAAREVGPERAVH